MLTRRPFLLASLSSLVGVVLPWKWFKKELTFEQKMSAAADRMEWKPPLYRGDGVFVTTRRGTFFISNKPLAADATPQEGT